MSNPSDDPRWQALSQSRRDELLGLYRDTGTHHRWWGCIYEQFSAETAPAKGFQVANMFFSGFWSQGDGACFTGSVGNWKVLLATLSKPETWAEVADAYGWHLQIASLGNYNHSGTMYAGENDLGIPDGFYNPFDEDDDPLRFDAWQQIHGHKYPTEWQLDDLVIEIMALARSLADDLYSELEAEYEHLTDDEIVIAYLLDFCKEELVEEPEDELEEAG
jgi:hypothetical protein